MKYILFLLLYGSVSFVFAQNYTLQIKDRETNEPVPFVKITPQGGKPSLADIDGRIELATEIHSFELHCFGYRDTLIEFSGTKLPVVYLTAAVSNLNQITVLPGENPAHRIMDQVIANRKKNDPLENDAFRYESYSKFIFDINRDKIDSVVSALPDTSSMKVMNFLDEQHILILESTSTREFSPPYYDKEEITAYKVSGFSNPALSTFANEMQGFSFYENQFNLLGKRYLNPIALGGTKRYLFVLEDTLVNGMDTTYTIFYRPRKGKNFEGLTGRMYINTRGYAVEKVTASPYSDTTGTSILIVQEYQLLNGVKWFPSKLSTAIAFKGLNVDLIAQDKTSINSYIEGKGSTYIRTVNLNPTDLTKKRFNPVAVVTPSSAGSVSDSTWEKQREYPLTGKEKRTYFMMDSLSKAEDLERKLNGLSGLLEGKLTMGKINLDLTKIVNYREYEGVRLGLGLETSNNFSRRFRFGGYFGWGTTDKTWKYGGFTTVECAPRIGLRLHLRYHDDLLERGGMPFEKEGFSLNNSGFLRELYITNMEKQRLAEIALSAYVRPNIKMIVNGNFQRIGFTDGYTYVDKLGSYSLQSTDLAETSLELTWNLFEKVMILGDKRISKGTRYPRIQLKVTKGWNGIATSQFDYWRFHTNIAQTIFFRGIGKWDINLTGSATQGDVPLFLLHVGNGTRMNWNVSVPNTFETMFPSEFYCQKQVALFTRLSFNAIQTKAKWNEPQFSFHHGVGVGVTENGYYSLFSSFGASDYRKGFWESGVSCNALFTNNLMGIGIAGFYRYGSYANADWKKNFVPKLTVTFTVE